MCHCSHFVSTLSWQRNLCMSVNGKICVAYREFTDFILTRKVYWKEIILLILTHYNDHRHFGKLLGPQNISGASNQNRVAPFWETNKDNFKVSGKNNKGKKIRNKFLVAQRIQIVWKIFDLKLHWGCTLTLPAMCLQGRFQYITRLE